MMLSSSVLGVRNGKAIRYENFFVLVINPNSFILSFNFLLKYFFGVPFGKLLLQKKMDMLSRLTFFCPQDRLY